MGELGSILGNFSTKHGEILDVHLAIFPQNMCHTALAEATSHLVLASPRDLRVQ
jgi:hypothetical protein